MENMGALFLRVATVSAGCSAVLAPVLLLAPRIQKKVAARTFYVLFLLLALRLTVPVELSLPVPVVRVSMPSYTVEVPTPEREQLPTVPAVPTAGSVNPVVSAPPVQAPAVSAQPVSPAPAPAQARQVPVTAVLGVLWAAGAAVCILWAVGGFLLARRRLLGSARPAGEAETALLEELRAELGVRRPVRLYRGAGTPGPLALGLFRPVIVLPADSGKEGLTLILRHELTHIRRWDVAYKLALSLACAVNWFNPLVWLMDRAAGRNLELCCDDEVVRDLTEAGRREYGRVLLAAAGSARPLPFTTCFAGGKRQMKNRLLNLFTQKRNSALLVCLVAVAALLAGGLVACEKASGSEITVSPENQARRELFQAYFDENYTEENASVVLADLTGDGLEELLVITLDPDVEDPPSLRGELVRFSYGRIEYFGVEDGAVVKCPATTDISDSHAGWGFVYLVPQKTGWAIAHYTPYIGQGAASYTCGVYTLDMDEGFVTVEQNGVFFQLERDSVMGGDTGSDDTAAEVEAFLERWQALRDSGVPLLVYYEDYTGTNENTERSYLSVPPAEAFGGKAEMTLPALREYVVTNGMESGFPLPEAWPETPEQALDWLESSLSAYSDGYVFRVPNYGGTWDIYISGLIRTGDGWNDFMSVHYLENETWVPGRRYVIETGEAELEDLTMYVTVIAPDGSGHTARYLTLEENGENVWNQPADIAAPPENVAAAYLETMARRMFLYEEGSGLHYTAYYGGRTMVVSYIPARNYELLDGRVLSQTEVQSRLRHMEDAVNCLKYRWMAEDIQREDVSIGYTVEQVEVDGNYAAVDIVESIGFRYRELTEPSGIVNEYRVDLARCDGTWLVVDVNQTENMSLWCDSKDEERFSTFADLPHDLDWFSNYINDHRTRPDWAQLLIGDESGLPVSCVAAGWFDGQDGSGEQCLKLIYSTVTAGDYQFTVRLEADDSLTLLDAVKIPRENG